MILCKYGCGLPGIFECKGFYNKGHFRCAKSSNSCTALKKKNKDAQPYNDETQRGIIIKKILASSEAHYGEGWRHKHGEKSKAGRLSKNPMTYKDGEAAVVKTNLERYGVRNVFARADVKEKRKKTNMARYGVPYLFQRQDFIDKMSLRVQEQEACKIISVYSDIRFNGHDSDKAQYLRIVTKLTRAVRKSLHLYSQPGFNLDHRYSVKAGYLNKVPPEIIASHHNLEFITTEENCSKQAKCSVSLDWLTFDFSWTHQTEQLFEDKQNQTRRHPFVASPSDLPQ